MFSFFYKNLAKITILLFIISGLLAGINSVLAQDDTGGEEDDIEFYCQMYKFNGASLVEEILEQSGINVDLEFKRVFGGTRKKPQVENLYMSLYKQVRETPDDSAMEKTAEGNQMTQVELCSILGGNYQLLSMIYDETYTVGDLSSEVARLKDEYERNLEQAARDQDMFLDTYSQEVFVNGDESDSGFDILYDLELIEYILFGEDSAIGSGMSDYAGENNLLSQAIDSPSEEETASDPAAAEEPSSPEESTPPEEEQPTAETEEGDEESVNPAECLADAGLQTAFDEAGITATTQAEADETDSSTEENNSEETGDDSDSSTDTGDDNSDDNDTTEEDDPWSTPKVCDGVFCLTIEFKNTEEPQLFRSSNCVKCHVDYIIQALVDTTSQNLNPGKLSGNLFEPSMCKRSLLSTGINLSFIPIAMPVQTPPADDIVNRNNFAENFMDFVKDTWPSAESKKYEEENSNSEASTYRQTTNTTVGSNLLEENIAYQQQIEDSHTTVEGIFTEAMKIYESQLQEIEDKFSTRNTVARAASTRDFYQDIRVEMDQMINYFTSYQNLIVLTQELVTDFKNNLSVVE